MTLNTRSPPFPIIGVGASAGGLEAVVQLLQALPARTGMALILIQHLDPKHESMTAEILSRSTHMPVLEVKDGTPVEPDHVYVIPPNHAMAISGGILRLLPRIGTRGPYMTIDFFFRSLAEDQGKCAIGVVLSGIASDGTQGIRAIKAAGGITMAQDPRTAKFDGMPRSAIDSGNVDFTLPPPEIANELAKIARHPYLKLPEKKPTGEEVPIARLYKMLRQRTKVDFSEYKHSTLHRRIARRMAIQKKETLEEYLEYVEKTPQELDALFSDILIHVTGFFRDPDAFESLKKEALPRLFVNRPPETPLRLWVVGCSTGEEVYSLAITVLEFLEKTSPRTPVQIFATDISDEALQKARAGIYPESIAQDVSRDRLKRFFVEIEGAYRIKKEVRDLCLFSRHDLTSDPPFAQLDLLSCRNLLIYFSTALQKRVLPILHYALKPGGILWLGKSETVSGFSTFFEPLDKTKKIFVRKPGRTGVRFGYPPGALPSTAKVPIQSLPAPFGKGFDLESAVDRAVLAESAPPGVVINDRMEILQFRGRTVPFLEPAPGRASHHLLKMAHPALVSVLRAAVQSAKRKDATSTKEGIEITDELGRVWKFDLKAVPIRAPAPSEGFLLILFERATIQETPLRGAKKPARGRKPKNTLEKMNARLEQELSETRKYQDSLAQDYEAAHEELEATNEEIQATNEELQSANEELETAKEELQSTNEELITVNEELQNRNAELNRLNNDLTNLLSSVEIPILMVGSDGQIRRFTPLAGKVLHLISGDLGRHLTDIKSNFSSIGIELDLGSMISEVTATRNPKEIEVQDREDHWYRVQVKPYRTLDGEIDGAVIAFIDIDILKRALKEATLARADAERANRAKDLFLATLSHELRTPLTTILTWAQMLRMGRLDAEKTKRAAELIEDSGKTQAQLINDLLDVSRIVMGKVALELQEVEPGVPLRAAIESVRSLADSKSIKIEANLEAEAGTVMADSARLQQVFWNLLTNSIKFSQPESRVSVNLLRVPEIRGKKARIQVQVIDSGKGISPEFLPHIFDQFTQADSSATRAFGGLGLGLSIVRNLLELQGGTIEAESAGLGKGATFTILLPLHSELKTQDTARREKTVKVQKNHLHEIRLDGLRVLVVEDEASAREAFQEMLTSYGAEVRTAASAQEALETLRSFKPDVLLTDIAMPEEDGYSLLRKVRALSTSDGGDVPSVAVTAHAGPEDIERARSAGFQAHVAKPVDSDYLANVVASVARHRKILKMGKPG